MIPKYPINESVLSWTIGTLSRCQKSWLRFLERVDDFWNTTMLGLEDKVSMGYSNEPIVHYLERLRLRMQEEHKFKDGKCSNRFVYGPFSPVLLFCQDSLKEVTQNPTSELRRITRLVPVSKARYFGSKTAQWLSRRPGQTIAEKVAPKNDILTQITVFVADTKENREAYYLYESLYVLLGKSLMECACAKCKKRECNEKRIRAYNSMRALFQKRGLIKANSFEGVIKQKQAVPNNRLISDPNYKCIWDSTRVLGDLDASMKKRWNGAFDEVVSLFQNALFAEISGKRNVKVYDKYGHLLRKSTETSFASMDGKTKIPLQARIEKKDEIIKVTIGQENKKVWLNLERFKRFGFCYEKAETKKIYIDFESSFNKATDALIDRSAFVDIAELLWSQMARAGSCFALPYLRDEVVEPLK